MKALLPSFPFGSPLSPDSVEFSYNTANILRSGVTTKVSYLSLPMMRFKRCNI